MARTHMVNRLGTELRRLRLKKGVSLRKVQTETGVSNPYLSQLERGVATSPAPPKLQVPSRLLRDVVSGSFGTRRIFTQWDG